MTKRRSDNRQQLDLLDWTPPRVADANEDETRVRAATICQRISRSVSETLRDASANRAEIAEGMSRFLGDDVTENMLNAYSSTARESHNISLERAVALVHATGDPRIFGDLLKPLGLAVIPERYLAAIEEAMWTEAEERASEQRRLARKRWRGVR